MQSRTDKIIYGNHAIIQIINGEVIHFVRVFLRMEHILGNHCIKYYISNMNVIAAENQGIIFNILSTETINIILKNGFEFF